MQGALLLYVKFNTTITSYTLLLQKYEALLKRMV